MLCTVLAEAGGTLVLVVTSSKFKLHWGVLVGGSVVIFYFLSWDIAISFTLSLRCGQVVCPVGMSVVLGSVVPLAPGSVVGLWY